MRQRHSDSWQPCPSGELARLNVRLQQRRRRRRWLGAVACGTAATAATATAGLLWWFGQPTPFPPGGLACSQVRDLLGPYQRGQLSLEERERVRQHLAQCRPCRELFQAMGLTRSQHPDGEG